MEIIRITKEMRDALSAEDSRGIVICQIEEVLEETMDVLGEYVDNEEDTEKVQIGENLLKTLVALYFGLRVDNTEKIEEQIIENMVEEIMGDCRNPPIGTAAYYLASGMGYMNIANRKKAKQ